VFKRFSRTVLSVVLVSIFSVAHASAAELKIYGSSTVARGVMAPNEANIERDTGIDLTIVTNGSSNGVRALAAGAADMAMISSPLDAVVKKTGVDATGWINHKIGGSILKVITHPSLSGVSLSPDQVKAVFKGEVTNWSAVGGPDRPILVVSEAAGGGTRTVFEGEFLDAEVTGKARTFTSITQVAKVVSQAPNAIGFGNNASLSSAVHVVDGITIEQTLSLVTKGAPTANQQKVIDAATKYAAQ